MPSTPTALLRKGFLSWAPASSSDLPALLLLPQDVPWDPVLGCSGALEPHFGVSWSPVIPFWGVLEVLP